ncbi:N-terminal EF-hand calcium-binding protein 3 isoform X2 [Sminthopsis crassicaudata]|uniref:N-terminal EF-hand calcium-binding protein 3 isoform X2 n=1 Tax=Sminthopsis crassicaudata TaxID=9301 RepID=UPI003D68669D
MSCVELLTMCLLRPKAAAREAPAALPAVPPPALAGLGLFQDVFRRADKNDDGKLSFEEFQNYFADGILSSGELRELFSNIDRHYSDNLETEKLCDYFSEHLGAYRPVLAALEALNSAVLAAMDATKLEYDHASKVDQFVMRFLLRETVDQLQALQGSLEGASDTLEGQMGGSRMDVPMQKAEESGRPRAGRRSGRRATRSICLSSSTPDCGILNPGLYVESDSQWMVQVNRLQQLIDQLECKQTLRLEPLTEGTVCKAADSILVAQRQISVTREALQDFQRALDYYTDFTSAQSSCLHVSVQQLRDEAAFILFEFWKDEASWKSHSQTSCSKAFQRVLIDHLQTPEVLTTMLFPGFITEAHFFTPHPPDLEFVHVGVPVPACSGGLRGRSWCGISGPRTPAQPELYQYFPSTGHLYRLSSSGAGPGGDRTPPGGGSAFRGSPRNDCALGQTLVMAHRAWKLPHPPSQGQIGLRQPWRGGAGSHLKWGWQ